MCARFRGSSVAIEQSSLSRKIRMMLFRSRRSERFPATVFKSQPGSAYFVGLNTKEIGCSFNLESLLREYFCPSPIDSFPLLIIATFESEFRLKVLAGRQCVPRTPASANQWHCTGSRIFTLKHHSP